MPNLYNNRNLVEEGFETFTKVQRDMGSPIPDEVSFVGGFLTCFGIITGRVDIGYETGGALQPILDSIHKDIASLGARIAANQRKQEADETIARAVAAAARRGSS